MTGVRRWVSVLIMSILFPTISFPYQGSRNRQKALAVPLRAFKPWWYWDTAEARVVPTDIGPIADAGGDIV